MSEGSAIELFLKRLLLRSDLRRDEQRAILDLEGEVETYRANRDIVSLGETVRTACLVARGLVGRFDQMLDGQRQITSFYLSGDMADLQSVVVPKARWAVTAVSAVTVIRVPHEPLRELCIRYPAIALSFWRDGTVDAAVLAKWVGNLGRKNAKARIAHLMCEMAIRSEAAELGTRNAFDLPISQERVGEAVGLTTVHVNRMLQEIRGQELLNFRGGRVEIFDWEKLVSIAEFDPAYLLLDGPAHRIDRPERRVLLSAGEN